MSNTNNHYTPEEFYDKYINGKASMMLDVLRGYTESNSHSFEMRINFEVTANGVKMSPSFYDKDGELGEFSFESILNPDSKTTINRLVTLAVLPPMLKGFINKTEDSCCMALALAAHAMIKHYTKEEVDNFYKIGADHKKADEDEESESPSGDEDAASPDGVVRI